MIIYHLFTYSKVNGGIITKLPLKNGKINNKKMIGEKISVVLDNIVYNELEIIEYIKGVNPKFKVVYNEKITCIECGNFFKGAGVGKIVNHNISLNNIYTDRNKVVHILILNKKNNCHFESLYSGNNIEKVINSTWHVKLDSKGRVLGVMSGNFNKEGNAIGLHQVDFPNANFVDHINNNPLDNRIENLRESNYKENNRNKRCTNKFGVVGIKEYKSGWCCGYNYNGFPICTKIKKYIEEVKLDALIAQRYLGYRHNEDMFYLLDNLPEERIKEVTDLLNIKMKREDDKIHIEKEYNHDIEYNGGLKIVSKISSGVIQKTILDLDTNIKNVNIYKSNGYWKYYTIIKREKEIGFLHRLIMGIKPNEYNEYRLHIDHLNNNPDDNRRCNLAITTLYSNQCNKRGRGYTPTKYNSFQVTYIYQYRFWSLVGGDRTPTFKTEQEAINEVNRRREIVDKYRVKLKSREELDELIEYCLDNNYTYYCNKNKKYLPDIDLGYFHKIRQENL